MKKGLLFVGGIGVGAALMYALDPDRGNRRRALARDKVASASHRSALYLGRLSRDVRNRARGAVAETTECIREWAGRPRGSAATDDQLVARVKSILGRHAVHHRALRVRARDGVVTLAGPALAAEVEEIVSAVGAVAGVAEVRNRLEVHEQAGDISSLQGEPAGAPSGGRW